MPYEIFVSYRRNFLEHVKPLVAALERVGIRCFLDVKDIDPLVPFPDCLRDAIDNSQVLLAVWTADYSASDHCMEEFKRAWQHARRHHPDVGQRVWILNPEKSVEHIAAGELDSQNFLQLPEPGNEDAWAKTVLNRLQSLALKGLLASEYEALPAPERRNVPNSSNEFTGRNAEMFRIHSKLHPVRIGTAGAAVAVSTHGLGGVGKTELAAK